MQKIKLITDPAVKIRVYLESENKIFLSGAEKRMDLEAIDNIDVPLPQFIFLPVHEQAERALQKNPYFQIVMAVRTAGSHFHNKKFQIIHYRMGYDLKLFFLRALGYVRDSDLSILDICMETGFSGKTAADG